MITMKQAFSRQISEMASRGALSDWVFFFNRSYVPLRINKVRITDIDELSDHYYVSSMPKEGTLPYLKIKV